MSGLYYEKPATCFEEALPVGNGRMGAMIYGGTNREEIQLNEESMWYGGEVDRINPNAREALPEIRRLIFDGKISEAEKLCATSLSGCPESMHPYQVLGSVFVQFEGIDEEIVDYRRKLSLDEALYTQRFKAGDTFYTREIFCSHPDDCIVMKFEATGDKKLNFDVVLRRERFFKGIKTFDERAVELYGNIGDGGVDYAFCVAAKCEDGNTKTIGERLVIENASSAILVITAQTSYRLKGFSEEELLKKVYCQAIGKLEEDYVCLKNNHIDDYKALYDRVKLQIGDERNDDKPTDERIKEAALKGFPDDVLSKKIFDYGRYLLISCSRDGCLPANLQGIWNKDMAPAWDSKYTVNINAEMNYWLAEICNLSECHIPLLELTKKVAQNGRKTAEKMYGCRGFVCHHNTDIHADTAPQDIWIPGTYWVMGGAWLATHIWKHYEYTNDIDFLREYYPIMKQSAVFFLDFLVEKDSFLVTCPSVSPENTYILEDGTTGCITYAATMDNQILRDLWQDVLKASEILGINDETTDEIRFKITALPPTRIASDGSVMEWVKEYKEAEPGHRHISHLYGLYPSNQITVDKTPELANAARKTLEKRLSKGGGHTGWSRAWIMNMYAALWDNEKCFENLSKFFECSVYPNLFDKHPPFQIDGNFGVTAAIANMLVQSDEDRIVLLPAVPEQWDKGSVSGLKVVGNGEVTLKWFEGSLSYCEMTFAKDTTVNIRYKERIVKATFKAKETKKIDFRTNY